MDLFKGLVDISPENGKIHEHFEFTKEFHKTTRCEKTDCDILKFLKPLEEVIFDPKKYDYNHPRNFFITNYIKHPNVFVSMLQLKTKENVNTVVQELRKKNLEQFHEQKKKEKMSIKLKIL